MKFATHRVYTLRTRCHGFFTCGVFKVFVMWLSLKMLHSKAYTFEGGKTAVKSRKIPLALCRKNCKSQLRDSVRLILLTSVLQPSILKAAVPRIVSRYSFLLAGWLLKCKIIPPACRTVFESFVKKIMNKNNITSSLRIFGFVYF